jgi:hypothetical protein
MPDDENDKPSEPEEAERRPPATGERADHHNAAPGVEIEGGPATDPARRDPEADEAG